MLNHFVLAAAERCPGLGDLPRLHRTAVAWLTPVEAVAHTPATTNLAEGRNRWIIECPGP
jgi:hypothetical protein